MRSVPSLYRLTDTLFTIKHIQNHINRYKYIKSLSKTQLVPCKL